MSIDKNIFILTEGIADLVFIKDFLKSHFLLSLKLETKINDNTTEIELFNSNQTIKIFQTKGKDFEINKINIIRKPIASFQPDKLLIIFDAEQNFGNSEASVINLFKEIYDEKEKNEIKKYIYLFPDNHNNGSLENLLVNIMSNTNINKCWTNFETCLKQKDKKFSILAKKSKIYTYLEILNKPTKKGFEQRKEINRDYTDDKWLLSDNSIPEIQNLKNFLNIYIL